MAKIWNWGIQGYSGAPSAMNILEVRSDHLPKGLNAFAHATLSQVNGYVQGGVGPSAQIWIHSYAIYDENGNESAPVITEGNPDSAFIENVAWVEVHLAVREAAAQGSVTLTEWN
jgi:hypothetical protein